MVYPILKAGLMTFILGIFRLGFMDVILSRALLRGFITAVVRSFFISAIFSIAEAPDILSLIGRRDCYVRSSMTT